MEVFHTRHISGNDFEAILSIVRRGGVIAFPTDTAYGLGADPFNDRAIARIFEIKQRPDTKPILLLVNSTEMAASVSHPGPSFHHLAERFWPGPLTLIVPASARLSDKITAGMSTVGLRWPLAEFAGSLIDRLGQPITATSANRSGMAAAVTAAEVRAQLNDAPDALVDGGTLPARGGSSILDLTSEPPLLVREGPISFESLHKFLEGRIRRQVA